MKIRKAVLRRRAEANAFTKAEKVEALAVKTSGARKAKYVKEWAERRHGKPESKKRTSLTRKCTRRCGDGALIFVTPPSLRSTLPRLVCVVHLGRS